MKRIVSVSLGSATTDYQFTASFLGHQFHIRRVGADGNVAKAAALLDRFQREADVCGLGMVGDHATVGTRQVVDRLTARFEQIVTRVPLTTGAALRTFLDEWAVRHVQNEEGNYFTNARVLFFSGFGNYRAAATLAEYTRNLRFADPITRDSLPVTLRSLGALERYAAVSAWLGRRRKSDDGLPSDGPPRLAWNRRAMRKAMEWAHFLVAPYHEAEGYTPEELQRKVLVTSSITDEAVKRLGEKGVWVIIDRTPQLLDRVVGLNIIDAMILAALEKRPDEISDDDYLDVLAGLEVAPRMIYPTGQRRRINRWAFVIHPLSQEYFKQVKAFDFISRKVGRRAMNVIERVMARVPPFVYAHVPAIESPTGDCAEGWLISVGGTPKQMLSHSPEFTYRRLLAASRIAERLGAQIMGLGAFTKVVGDAGITVARRANIPITTGNSYSASGALWAAADAVRRMGLVPLTRSGKVKAKAMVIGATGAIGSACARLLAQVAEEVVLVSIETAKLFTLRDSILKDTPDAKLRIARTARESLAEMDMIVTATSAAGKKILDITRVKPGCVITDVARPLDLPPEEVAKRPDVLVIESGEIRLPGDVPIRDIGLPKNVVYACLAETIVLALEGRFENYTIGRNIEWQKVKEIYKLGLKHGMQLAAISGVNGVFSDADIARVRDLALAARGLPAVPAPTRELDRPLTPVVV